MHAIEFQTIVRDGTIEIPPEHRAQFQHRVKVILLAEDVLQPDVDLIDQLLAKPLQVKGFRPLGREEADVR